MELPWFSKLVLMMLFEENSFELWINHPFDGEKTVQKFCDKLGGQRYRSGFRLFDRVFLVDEGPGIRGDKCEDEEHSFMLGIRAYSEELVSLTEQEEVISRLSSLLRPVGLKVFLYSEHINSRWLVRLHDVRL